MKHKNRGYCYGCGEKDSGKSYGYRDESHGITEDVVMCWRCLLKHVEKYYGDCPISKSIRRYHDSEKLEPKQLTLL